MGNIINPSARQPVELATSTIALSIFNILVVYGIPMSLAEIYRAICTGHNTELSKAQVVEAMHGLCKRRFLCVHLPDDEIKYERFSPAGSVRSHVRHRDRSGDGWDNWLIDGPQGVRRLEEVIR